MRETMYYQATTATACNPFLTVLPLLSLKFFFHLCLLNVPYMCYEQHAQNHILALKFHEVHFENQITMLIFSSPHKALFPLHL